MSLGKQLNLVIESAKTELSWFFHPLFELGKAEFSLAKVAFLVLMVIFVVFLSGRFKNIIIYKVLKNRPVSHGTKYAVATLARYVFLTLGLVLVLNPAGQFQAW